MLSVNVQTGGHQRLGNVWDGMKEEDSQMKNNRYPNEEGRKEFYSSTAPWADQSSQQSIVYFLITGKQKLKAKNHDKGMEA